MSQSQYLKMLEREIQKINKKIDLENFTGRKVFQRGERSQIAYQKSSLPRASKFLGKK